MSRIVRAMIISEDKEFILLMINQDLLQLKFQLFKMLTKLMSMTLTKIDFSHEENHRYPI